MDVKTTNTTKCGEEKTEFFPWQVLGLLKRCSDEPKMQVIISDLIKKNNPSLQKQKLLPRYQYKPSQVSKESQM